jgi:Ser/Thr protein kinase RdoA (MazF antagonist)
MGPAMENSLVHKIVLECLASNYGLEGSLDRLPGENLNFLVTAANDRRYVLKIVDQDMPPAVVEMEFAAIEHAVAAGFKPRLPQIYENKYGKIETGIKLPINGLYRARLITFLGGKDMASISDISIYLLKNVGETVASFNQVMQDFEHPAAHRDHRWNLASAGRHEDKIRLFSDPGERELLAWAYQGWRTAECRFAGLPHQFIHGDAHDENLLVEGGRVTGLIDFGDCCYNPTICDLAICMTYLMMRGPDPLSIAAAVANGYRQIRALSSVELAVLYPLICARLAVSVCVANERKAIDPSNPNWFGGEELAWKLLERLRALGPGSFDAALRYGS